jgi:DNA polymerase-3 subunit delta
VSLPNVVLLIGDEGLARKEAEEALVSKVFGDASPSFNLATFSASDGAERAVEAARTVPMMAKMRVVIIRDMEQAGVGLLDSLLSYIEKPCPSTVFIMTGIKLPPAKGGVDRGRRLEGRLRKSGHVERFKSGSRDPVRFAVERAQEGGCDLDSRAARLLVELVGGELGRVQTEVDKLAAYVGGEGRIGADDVEAVCSMVAEAIIWDLTDALVRKDPNQALAVSHRLLETGEAPHRLMAMITWQIRQLLALQDCMQQGLSPRDSGIRMPGRKMSAAQDALRRRPMNPEKIFDTLAAANRSMNRSRAGERRVFEGLLLALSR